jgi:hypothetical protein
MPRNPVLKSLLKAAPVSQMLWLEVWNVRFVEDWALSIAID